MIISDLEHFSAVTAAGNVVGGFSLADYLGTTLASFSSDSSTSVSPSISSQDINITTPTGSFSTSLEGNNNVQVSIFAQGERQATSFAQSGDLVTSLPF